MPQIRNTTTEDYGADDEVKEYKQDEDENEANETNVDLVNDIKSDLIKKDAERIEAKRDSRPVFQHYGAITGPHQTEIFRPLPGPHAAYPRQDNPYYSGRVWHPNRPHMMYGSPQYTPHYPNSMPVSSVDTSILRPPGNITDDQRHGHMVAPPMNTSVICHTSITGLPNSQAGTGNGSTLHENGHMKKVHVKKPLNAFMLYMKEMRSKVISECTLKESAAINQILGKRWHQLDRAEQAKYYDQARRERAIHMQLYPGWSARENYAQQGKKKKRKRDKSQGDSSEANNPKKCRARYGLDRQHEWCKPCRRKKKCIRFVAGNPNPQDLSENEDGSPAAATGAESSTSNSADMASSDIELVKAEPIS